MNELEVLERSLESLNEKSKETKKELKKYQIEHKNCLKDDACLVGLRAILDIEGNINTDIFLTKSNIAKTKKSQKNYYI